MYPVKIQAIFSAQGYQVLFLCDNKIHTALLIRYPSSLALFLRASQVRPSGSGAKLPWEGGSAWCRRRVGTQTQGGWEALPNSFCFPGADCGSHLLTGGAILVVGECLTEMYMR